MSCSMRISVIAGSSLSSVSVSRTRSARERPAAGSSSIISFGSLARAMPTSSWRCSPCESSETRMSSWSVRPTASPIARAFSRISESWRFLTSRKCPSWTPSTARYRLSSTERPRKSREVWKVRESPMRARLRDGNRVTSVPNSSTVPALGGNSPEIRLNSVVLPAPLGLRIARRSPGATSRSTPRTAWTPPKRRPTPRKRRIGAARSADVAGAATCLLRREVDLLGVADPGRLVALRALRVGAVGSRRVGRERAAERLLDAGDAHDRLHVRDLVAVGVGDDLLDEVVRDAVAVLVELDLAPRRVEGDGLQSLLELALIADVALDRFQALGQGPRRRVVVVDEHGGGQAGDLLAVRVVQLLDVLRDLRVVGVRRRRAGRVRAGHRVGDLLEDQRVVEEDVAHGLLGVDLDLLLLVLLHEGDQAGAADAVVDAVDVVRDLGDEVRVDLLTQRRPDALGALST